MADPTLLKKIFLDHRHYQKAKMMYILEEILSTIVYEITRILRSF